MVIERTTAKKTLAVTLAMALFASAPMSAWSQSQAAAARAASGVASPSASAAPAAAALSGFTLNAPVSAPALQALNPTLLTPMPGAENAELRPLAAPQPLSVEAHPVIGLLNALQAKGIVLPETLSTREDAAGLVLAAQAMSEGSAKRDMLALAAAIGAANNTGSPADMGGVYDAARAQAPEAAPVRPAGWRSLAARLLPAPLARMVAPQGGAVQPANPEDFAVKVADARYVPSTAQLPDNTFAIVASDRQIVGQDGALKAIKFGLQMPGRHYNLFVSGPHGSGRKTALRHVLPEVASKMTVPGDRVAVTNFRNKDNPLILELEAGLGPVFAKAVRAFVSNVKSALPATLESGAIAEARRQVAERMQAAAAEREAAFRTELKKITLAGGVFGVEFFAKPAGEGRMSIGLLLTRGGRIVDPGKVEERIAAGDFTRAQFDAASRERDQAFPAVMEKFKAMIGQNNGEMAAARERVETQVAASVINQAGQELMAAVTPEAAATPEMIALRAKLEKWLSDFTSRVNAVKVEGFGLSLVGFGDKLVVAYTRDGEALVQAKLDELMRKGLTPAEFAEIKTALSAAAKPLLAEYAAKLQEHAKAQQALTAKQSQSAPTPERLRAASYVKVLLQYAIANRGIFMGQAAAPSAAGGVSDAPGQRPIGAEDFFQASVLSSNGGRTGAPVVWVSNPTLEKVFGKADDNKRMMLIPGVGLIKGGAPGGPTLIGGAIQQAEGGFLVLDFMDVMRAPGLYQALMAAARSGEASMVEDGLDGLRTGKGASYHVPSRVKIVLVGSQSLRLLVQSQDRDFALNFQATADFESTLKVNEESVAGYLQFFKKAVLSLASELEQGVMELTRDAMSALIEHGARLADSNKKLTAQFGALYGVIREASYWAREAGRNEVRREDVDAALSAKQDREEVAVKKLREVYENGVFQVLTSGAVVGQVNGLAVQGPTGVILRTTALAFAGTRGVVAIDQGAGMLGPTATKATANIGGALAAEIGGRMMQKIEIHLSYEQSYGGVEGDSASQTQYIAALSALSGVPVKQNLSITGSLDQGLRTQAIGGANQKIEAFFALCKSRGLTGEQGAIVPRTNVADLQLSPEIVQAVREGKFHVYAVENVRQAAELLTGVAYSTLIEKARARAKALAKGD